MRRDRAGGAESDRGAARSHDVAAVWLLCAVGCTGTTFSNYQTARLLAPGRSSFTAGAGAALHRQSSQPAHETYDYAVSEGTVAYRRGLTPRLEAGARFSWLHQFADAAAVRDEELLFADVKYSILSDELAVAMPMGVGWRQSHVHDIQVQPSVIHTATLSRTLELDSAAKLIVIADNGNSVTTAGQIDFALAVGLRIHSDRWRFELHPEIGFLIEDVREKYVSFGQSILVGAGLAVIFSP